MCLDVFGCVFGCGRGGDFDEKQRGGGGGNSESTEGCCDLLWR